MAKTQVATTINHEAVEFLCEPRQSLLEVLRDIPEANVSLKIDHHCIVEIVQAQNQAIKVVKLIKIDTKKSAANKHALPPHTHTT